MNHTTVSLLIKREASATVGNSTLRGQGSKGVVHSARKFLSRINIEKYSSAQTKEEFLIQLDEDTKKLMKSFPTDAQNWGAVRKSINIFLRNDNFIEYECHKTAALFAKKFNLQPKGK